MKEIIFIFNQGRIDRLNHDPSGPKEFFYTYHKFKETFNNVDLIESNVENRNIFKFLFKFLRKLSTLPIYTENFLNSRHLKSIFNSKVLIATNQNLAFSVLPILIIKKIFTKTYFYTFGMGLLENQLKKGINIYFFNLFLKLSEKIFFISRNEFEQAKKILPKFKHKFLYIPFAIDTDFWDGKNNSDKKYILFNGNDMNRDYDFIFNLAKKMRDYDFVFITQRFQNINLPNVKLIKGNWNDNILSDEEVKKYYELSHVTLIPLKQTYQPSGQSVALQSASMETPVFITRTKGFWDNTLFEDSKNIIFIDENNLDLWKEKIDEVLSNKEFYNLLSSNGKKLINKEFNIDKMYLSVLDEIKSVEF